MAFSNCMRGSIPWVSEMRGFTCRANFDSTIHLCIWCIISVSRDCVQLFLKTSKIDKEYILNCLRLIAIDPITNV